MPIGDYLRRLPCSCGEYAYNILSVFFGAICLEDDAFQDWLMVGRANIGRSNSANLWESNRYNHNVRICTGYALSEDGLWHQHTWLVHYYETATRHRIQVIETTCNIHENIHFSD